MRGGLFAVGTFAALIGAATAGGAPIRFAGHDVYVGDLHAHTGLSLDGGSSDLVCPWGNACGPSATVLADARDVYGLDFVALTDHGNGLHALLDVDDWAAQLAEVQAAYDPDGGFVTVPAVELWLWHADGEIRDHRNLYLLGDADQLAGLTLDEIVPDEHAPPFTTDDCPQIFDWLAGLEEQRGPMLFFPHHVSLEPPAAADWSCHDARFAPVVEDYSEHGNSQTASEPGSFDAPDPADEQRDATVEHAIALDGHALVLGFVGGTDSHDTRPGSVCDLDPRFASKPNFGGGLTLVHVDEGQRFDRAALLDALRARRTASTSGPRIPVRFELLLDGIPFASMGDDTSFQATVAPTVEVEVPPADAAYVTSVDLVLPGVRRLRMDEVEPGLFRAELPISTAETVVVHPELTVDGAAYWADAELDCDDGGDGADERIWPSPIWVTMYAPPPPPDEGCRCHLGRGGAPAVGPLAALAAVAVLALRRRRR